MQSVSFDGRIIHEDISKTYRIGKELGSGHYGSVRVLAKRSFLKKRFALKSIHRDRISSDIDMLERELDILMNIDHPNIIDFQEIYMDDLYFNFVTQLCEGNDLFTNLE
jgi:serine/threonine protein kinase